MAAGFCRQAIHVILFLVGYICKIKTMHGLILIGTIITCLMSNGIS